MRADDGAMVIQTFPAAVLSIVALRDDVLQLRLRLENDAAFTFQAGQFIAIHGPDGQARCYSMAARACAAQTLELHVRLHAQGRFSRWLDDARSAPLATLTPLSISGPYGDCTWQADAHSLLLATGTGIAPLKALIEEALDHDAPHRLTLYWGGRTQDDLYLRGHFTALARRDARLRFVPVLSRPQAGWHGARGFVQHVAATDHPDLRATRVYACGNASMVDAAQRLFVERHGLAAGAFHADVFEVAAPAPDAQRHAVEAPVRIDAAGQCDTVRLPVGESLMEGLRRAGRLQGVCGGRQACGSCRVQLSPEWFERLPPAGRNEQRLLASLDDARPFDRLACQVAVAAHPAGLALSLPERRL